MPTIKANQLKKDMFVLHKGTPHAVLKCEFYFPGKGAAFARTKLKNVRTDTSFEYTFKSSEPVEIVEVETTELQYLYHDGESYFFMDPRTFEQFTVLGRVFDGREIWLLPEAKMFFSFYEGEAIGVRFPVKVEVKVTEAEEAVAGNTVGGAKKPVTVETGAEVMVPLFIKTGDSLVIDTETGGYVSRG